MHAVLLWLVVGLMFPALYATGHQVLFNLFANLLNILRLAYFVAYILRYVNLGVLFACYWQQKYSSVL